MGPYEIYEIKGGSQEMVVMVAEWLGILIKAIQVNMFYPLKMANISRYPYNITIVNNR